MLEAVMHCGVAGVSTGSNRASSVSTCMNSGMSYDHWEVITRYCNQSMKVSMIMCRGGCLSLQTWLGVSVRTRSHWRLAPCTSPALPYCYIMLDMLDHQAKETGSRRFRVHSKVCVLTFGIEPILKGQGPLVEDLRLFTCGKHC